MAVDVVLKPISANAVKNGTSVIFESISSVQVRDNKFSATVVPSIDALFDWFNTRFDDPTYYTNAT